MSTEELGAAFFPGAPEAWATPTALAPFPELAPAHAAPGGLPHPALIPHHPAALAQMPIRVSITSYLYYYYYYYYHYLHTPVTLG